MTGDQGLGQVEMKIGDTHGETLERPRSLPEMCFPRHEPD
ncbi:S-adenosylmethionine--tRNA ribosyltransferase-isomerase [Pseudomonas aeruginosa]|nr:S-adenosylmethionine--tRNA ribosyltransferase-isomerase [Pseudomonas aeruginosa]